MPRKSKRKPKPELRPIDVTLEKMYFRHGYMWMVMKDAKGNIYKQKCAWRSR